MLVDLERVPPEGQVIDRSVSASALALDSRDFRLCRAVSIAGRVLRADNDAYRLRGHLTTEIEIACVRCLEPFVYPVREDLDLLYLPESQNVATEGSEEHGLDDEELNVGFYRDDEIDLAHMIWEQIVLALPMKPVCKVDCQGLCPSCGVNRNVSQCRCVHDAVDPRWESLKNLL